MRLGTGDGVGVGGDIGVERGKEMPGVGAGATRSLISEGPSGVPRRVWVFAVAPAIGVSAGLVPHPHPRSHSHPLAAPNPTQGDGAGPDGIAWKSEIVAAPEVRA